MRVTIRRRQTSLGMRRLGCGRIGRGLDLLSKPRHILVGLLQDFLLLARETASLVDPRRRLGLGRGCLLARHRSCRLIQNSFVWLQWLPNFCLKFVGLLSLGTAARCSSETCLAVDRGVGRCCLLHPWVSTWCRLLLGASEFSREGLRMPGRAVFSGV